MNPALSPLATDNAGMTFYNLELSSGPIVFQPTTLIYLAFLAATTVDALFVPESAVAVNFGLTFLGFFVSLLLRALLPLPIGFPFFESAIDPLI